MVVDDDNDKNFLAVVDTDVAVGDVCVVGGADYGVCLDNPGCMIVPCRDPGIVRILSVPALAVGDWIERYVVVIVVDDAADDGDKWVVRHSIAAAAAVAVDSIASDDH